MMKSGTPNLHSVLLIFVFNFIFDTGCDQVTLLTTEGTTTDLKWRVENMNEPPGFSGWEDISIPYKETIVRGYQVCDFNQDQSSKEKPQTWLLLPGVSIDGGSRIFVEMNFTMRECSDLEKTCRETFSVFYRLTNGSESGSQKEKFNSSTFKKIDTVAAEVRFTPSSPTSSWNSLINSETVSISLKNSTKTTSLHIAIVDVGACVALMGVRIYHKVCRETKAGFAYFQETKTGISDASLVPVTGTCVLSAVYLESGRSSTEIVTNLATSEPILKRSNGPLYHCTSSGDWQVQTGSCQCKPGHQPDETESNCIPCRNGTYKPLPGNHNCLECPVHSSTVATAATTCQCDPEYDLIGKMSGKTSTDILSGGKNSHECELCSKFPESPSSLRINGINKQDPGFVKISWKKPTDDGGCSNVQYCILCQFYPGDTKNWTALEDNMDCDHLHYEPSGCHVGVPKVTAKGLRGHAKYNFTVVAFTLATKQKFPELIENLSTESSGRREKMNFSKEGISSLLSEDMGRLLQASSVSILYTTGDTLPSAVRNPTIAMENQTAIFVKWEPPEFPNGKILYYKVQYGLAYEIPDESPEKGPARYASNHYSWEETTTNETNALLTDLYPGSKYQIFITAHNSAGSDNSSAPLSASTVSFDDDNNEKPTSPDNFAYLIATVVIATLVVMICLLLIIQWKCRSRKEKRKNLNGTAEQPTEFRPYNSHHETLDQRTYVDPYSLHSLPPHRFLCETSPDSIACGQVIGCGEFGEVYKGTLATIDLNSSQETTINVAVKQLRDQCEPQEQIDFLREAMSLEKFRHPNVVHLEAVVTKSRPFFIVTELMAHGSLHGFLTQMKQRAVSQTNRRGWTLPLTHVTLAKMLRGVASGMEYLCGKGFVHRDLAARNVLVNFDLVCKVADFGLMREIESNDSESGSNGSGTYTTRGGKIAIRWTAPEAIALRTFTQFSDVWSFGILTWEATSFGEKPYWDLTNHEVIKAATDGMRLPAPEKCPSVLHQLMLECWQRDPHKRPTFTKIISKFNQMISEPDVLEVPASPASCGVQPMFFEEEESAAAGDFPLDLENSSIRHPQDDCQGENTSADPFLTTVVVDRHNIDVTDDSANDDFELPNRDEEEGSEVSSCTSTICASEITVYAGNAAAVYVPLLRSDSDEIRPITPTRTYYSLTR